LVTILILTVLAALIFPLRSSNSIKVNAQSNTTLLVPQAYPTIQSAIDAAASGDTIIVAPGMYQENLDISGKAIRLISEFAQSGDPAIISGSVIDGQLSGSKAAITIQNDSTGTEINGFTIQNAEAGISARSNTFIVNNRFIGTVDGISVTNTNVEIRNNTFEQNTDDGIDFDEISSGIIENNIICNNGNDGIEVRLHNYTGDPLNITIRGNFIANNQDDGIQLIDYPKVTPRVFLIERNIIVDNGKVGIGLMDKGKTFEDFRGAPIPERIMVYDNTFSGNPYGLTGGANLIAINNIFANSSQAAMKNVQSGSIAAHNLFWANNIDYENCSYDPATTFSGDPLLDAAYQPASGSPAIDAGTAHFVWNGETVLDIAPEHYSGSAPDLGHTD